MSHTINLELPVLASGQAQKHVTVNEALLKLDNLVQLSVISASLPSPPPQSLDGARYIVPAGAQGAWTGHSDKLAIADQGSWVFATPKEGWLAFVEDLGAHRLRIQGQWRSPPGDVGSFNTIGVGASPDQINRLTVAAPGTLLTHAGDGHRLAINKAAGTATGSIVFQTNHDAKAEIGCTGTNNLHLRTLSATEGWRDRMVIEADTGHVGIGTSTPVLGPATGSILHVHASASSACWSAARFTTGEQSGAGDGLLVGNLCGAAYFWHYQAGPILFGTHSAVRMTITSGGNVGIGVAAPSCQLHVDGPIRIGSSTVAALPLAATVGAGTLMFVSDDAGGATLAFSDGSAWRRTHDRGIVT